MLKHALLSFVIVATIPSWSLAQGGFADLIDHIHLAAPDQAKAVEWYRANFGAETTAEGPDRAMLGTTRLIFQKSDMMLSCRYVAASRPNTCGSNRGHFNLRAHHEARARDVFALVTARSDKRLDRAEYPSEN